MHLLQVRRYEAPYRAAVATIRGAPTDVVVVDPSGMRFANDLVRNDPFLRNRPKVLTLGYLDDAQIETLCSRFSVSVFDKQQDNALGRRLCPPSWTRTRRSWQRNAPSCGIWVAISGAVPAAWRRASRNHDAECRKPSLLGSHADRGRTRRSC